MRLRPVMLADPIEPFSAQIEPPRLNRAIADNWRGLYGSDPFSSMSQRAAFRALGNGSISPNISMFAGLFAARMAARHRSRLMPAWTMEYYRTRAKNPSSGARTRSRSRSTLAIRNLTGWDAKRIFGMPSKALYRVYDRRTADHRIAAA